MHIYFTKLVLKGPIKDYSIDFKKGLNIISGPINTGKTTILDIIDYCLGARSHPKYEEIRKISLVLLEFVINNDYHVIERKMFSTSRDITIHITSLDNMDKKHEEKEISAYQIPDKESISSYLLKKLNLNENNLSEISSLSKLVKLERVLLYHNQIADASPLCSLQNLSKITLGCNKITNIEKI